MTPGNGTPPPDSADKSLGEIVSEVSEKASLLVREEIELAKSEIQQKIGRLTKGAAVGIAAGVFGFFAFIMFLHTLSLFWFDLFDLSQAWMGYGITTLLLLLFGAASGILAYRFIKRGAPPTPDLAIEQAKLTREALEQQSIERDQLERGRT
jgi:Putative Actinobacterial Holin-X, holin superfamily III